jgi:hypothetical protein
LVLIGLASDIDGYLNDASAIQYTGAQDVSGDSAAVLTLTANDGAGDVVLGTVNVDLTAAADATVLTGLVSDVTVVEDVAADVDLSAVSLLDADANAGFALTLSASSGILNAVSSATVIVTGAGTGALVLTGLASDIDGYLNDASAIQYTGAQDVNGDSAAVITLIANDGAGDEVLGSVNVDIAAVDDTTAISGLVSDVTVLEDAGSDVDLSSMVLTDVDANAGFTLTITANTGILSAYSNGSVSVSGAGTGTIVLTGIAADIDAYLNDGAAIQYTGVQDVNGNDAAVITLTANDGAGDIPLGSVNVDVAADNDATTLTGLVSDVTAIEDVASDLDLSAVVLTDIDANTGFTLTLSMTTMRYYKHILKHI